MINRVLQQQRFPLIVLLACFSLTANTSAEVRKTGRENQKSHLVEAVDAGYVNASGSETGKKITGTQDTSLLAKASPKSRVIKITNEKSWQHFLSHYSKPSKKSGEPPAPKQFSPDFKKEIVWIVVHQKPDNTKAAASNRYSDIELYEHKDHIKAFAFLLGTGYPGKIQKDTHTANHFYCVTLPRKFADKPIEFRIGYQSWGRVCSKFSPAIKPEENKGNE